MNKWLKNLGRTFDKDQIVEIDRSPKIDDTIKGYIEGYVVGVSELFVMLHVLDSAVMNLNGYIVLRNGDIQRYRIRDDYKFFLNRALTLKGIRPIQQPEIDLTNLPALLSSVNAHFPVFTIHREIMNANTCFIGCVQKITDKTITLAEISPAAEWDCTRRYNFRDITRVDFGGGYEQALALVAEHEAQK